MMTLQRRNPLAIPRLKKLIFTFALLLMSPRILCLIGLFALTLHGCGGDDDAAKTKPVGNTTNNSTPKTCKPQVNSDVESDCKDASVPSGHKCTFSCKKGKVASGPLWKKSPEGVWTFSATCSNDGQWGGNDLTKLTCGGRGSEANAQNDQQSDVIK